MATDPSQIAKFLGRIACFLRRRLLGSPTRHPYFSELLTFIMNALMNLSRPRPARAARSLLHRKNLRQCPDFDVGLRGPIIYPVAWKSMSAHDTDRRRVKHSM